MPTFEADVVPNAGLETIKRATEPRTCEPIGKACAVGRIDYHRVRTSMEQTCVACSPLRIDLQDPVEMQTHFNVAKQIDVAMESPQVFLKSPLSSPVSSERVRKGSVRVTNRYRTRPHQKHQQTTSGDRHAEASWLARFV